MNNKVSSFQFSSDVVGVLIEEDISGKLMDQIHAEILERLEQHKKINLFVEIKDGKKISFAAFWKDVVFKYEHSNDFRKVAVVTNIEWFKRFVDIKDKMSNAKMKIFDHKDRIEALNWIME